MNSASALVSRTTELLIGSIATFLDARQGARLVDRLRKKISSCMWGSKSSTHKSVLIGLQRERPTIVSTKEMGGHPNTKQGSLPGRRRRHCADDAALADGRELLRHLVGKGQRGRQPW